MSVESEENKVFVREGVEARNGVAIEGDEALESGEVAVVSTEDLMAQVNDNINQLRREQREQALHVLEEEPPLESKLSGDVFIESIGSTVHLERGDYQHIYNSGAITARDVALQQNVRARRIMFEAIGERFEEKSRVLNIGAGGDTTLINAHKLLGHDVICTDFSREATETLSKRSRGPIFAVDLANLDRVMPDNSVDYCVGNSTLGYVEPSKLRKVVDNLCAVMKKGGAFTFDLIPHGVYAQIIEDKEKQTVVNESDVDPMKLLEFVKKYGPQEGVNAMAVYHSYRSVAMQLAVMDVLKELFKEKGFEVSTGFIKGTDKNFTLTHVLCVGNTGEIKGEHRYENVEEGWEALETLLKAVRIQLRCVDRQSATLLAKEFGIEAPYKVLPYYVADFVDDNQDIAVMPNNVKSEVSNSIHPKNIRDLIKPYIDGKKVPVQEMLSTAVQTDQIVHKFLMNGEAPFSPDDGEMKIDAAYASERLLNKQSQPVVKKSGSKKSGSHHKKKRR